MSPFPALCSFLVCSMTLAETNPSLASVLTPDGRIIGGVSGSFVPAGFSITNDPGGEPIPPSDEQSVEGQWDNRFGVPTGVGGTVHAVALSGSNVYVGGEFTDAGFVSADHIACWDGSSWSALGSGVNGTVFAIAVSGSDVYVGGYFTQAGGVSANCIARWDGSSWSALGSGLNYTVRSEERRVGKECS